MQIRKSHHGVELDRFGSIEQIKNKQIMRKITLLLVTVFMALTGYAQENRALFSGDGLIDSSRS